MSTGQNNPPHAARDTDDKSVRKTDKTEADQPKSDDDDEQVDRPGFDLGGTDNNTSAGKGLGLGTDAREGRKDWGVRGKR